MKSLRLILLLCILTLLAYSSLDAASKQKRGVQIAPKSEPSLASLYDQSYAVIIGINAYEKWPSLEYAVNDARSVEKRLKDMGFQTTLFIDGNATRDNILKLLGDDLPRKVDKNDRVIIFFAGHGQTEELADGTKMGYIVPVDGDTRNIYSTAISMSQVRDFSHRLKAKHVIYLVDSCYSGLGLTRSGSIPPGERDYLRKITNRKAHQMLTAGGKGEQVHEEGNHGVFTRYLLEALDGLADRDGKGYVTFSDIAFYVKPKVSRFTQNRQTPQYGNIDGEGEFVFTLSRVVAPAESAEMVGLVQERQRIADEKKSLEQEKARLAAQKEQLEEARRLGEERRRLEEERQAVEAERRKMTETTEAAPQAEKATKAKQDLIAVEWHRRGIAAIRTGNNNEAITALTKAIQLDPQYVTAYIDRAFAYSRLGNYQRVLEDSNRAIELNPGNAKPYVNRGLGYSRLGNHKQAIEDYNKAIELNPTNTLAYVNRSSVYIKVSNYKQAVKDASKAIELDPKNALAYYNRGTAYAKLGQKKNADNDYKTARSLGLNFGERKVKKRSSWF